MNLLPLSWKKIQATFQIFILHAINSCFSIKIYPSHLYFTVSSIYGYLFIVSGCPPPCTCGIRSIDCSMSELTVLPNLEDFTSVSFINFSFNDFKSLKENDTYIPPLTVLDFSFSHISFIPDNFFRSEHFLRLEILNLTGNPLGEVNFALPVSVKVLKLSKNSLQDLSLSRLCELVDLQTLHVEHNKLKFLHSDREKTSSFNDITKDRVNIEKKSDTNNDCLFEPFKHIVEVSYRGNHIQMIQLSALNCFKNVAYLSLADNRLESVPKKAFDAFNRLQFLDLSGNQLKSLPVDIFKKISSLKFLSLSSNKLRNVPANLPMMEWLDLSFNNIVSVAEEQKSDLYPQEVFLLGGNPLHCDCQLLWVKELYDTREYLLNYIEVDKNNFIPICASPEHLKGDTWDVLGDESFSCSASKDLMKSALNSIDEGLLIHLEDLSISVVEVGSSHVILEWDSLRLATTAETHQDPGKLDKMLITCHQFGKKSAQSAFAVPVGLGHYTLKALNSNTAYVICISLTNPTSKAEHFNKAYHENCVEIITQGSYFMHIFNGVMEQYIIIISVLFIILWVVIRFCYPMHEIQRGKVD